MVYRAKHAGRDRVVMAGDDAGGEGPRRALRAVEYFEIA
jgi:hypothetical protein